jgi:hypothetical protein
MSPHGVAGSSLVIAGAKPFFGAWLLLGQLARRVGRRGARLRVAHGDLVWLAEARDSARQANARGGNRAVFA